MLAERRKRLDHVGPLGRRLDVRVEHVFPRSAGTRSGLELRHVHLTLGECAQAAVERAGDVPDPEDQRRLVRLRERRRIARQRAETCVVVGIRLDALGEDGQPVELAGTPRGDRRRVLEALLRDPLRRARRVVLGPNRDVERVEELLALGDRLRVRGHLAELVERRPGEGEQAVVDADDGLADEVQPVPQEEVVRLVDAAGLRVVHRHEAAPGTADLDGLEDGADRGKRPVVGLGKEGDRAFLGEGACLALVRDYVDPRTIRSSVVTAPSTVELNGREVRRIGLGTNRLTRTPGHVAFIRDAVASGLQLIDTAYTYRDGESEATIGEALSQIPETCIVATKGGYYGARPEVLGAEIEESLRRLHTDRIGLYYLHRPDPQIPLEESLGRIKEYRDKGKIRLVGISQVSVEQIERARRVVPIAAVQNHYSLNERTHDDVIDHCEQEGIAFVPYFPLRGVGSPNLTQIARAHGATEHQIALAWLLRRSPAMLPIPGTLSLEHLKDNLRVPEIALTDADVEALS